MHGGGARSGFAIEVSFFSLWKKYLNTPLWDAYYALIKKERKMSQERVYYTYKGKRYEIIEGDVPPQQLLRDFKHCESRGDWVTINNRILGGLTWGWLIEVENFKEEL